MLKNTLFNVLIAIVLLVVVALTVREAAATSSITSQADSVSQAECNSLPSRYSIHTEYVEELGAWRTYTEDGPTGVDGGLIYLLSKYGTCLQ